MKKTKMVWLIAIIAIIGFAACRPDGDDSSHEHSWSEWTVDVLPNCVILGSQSRSCEGCGESQTEEIAVDTDAHDIHAVEGSVPIIAPTCMATGTGEVECVRGCGYTAQTGVIPMLPHNLERLAGGVTTASTCVDTGIGVMECVNDDCTHTEPGGVIELDGDAHTWGGYKQLIEPTCYSKGVNQRTCDGCNHPDPVTQEGANMIAHNLSGWRTIIEATCLATGTKEQDCRVEGCGFEEDDIIPIDLTDGHDWLYDPGAIPATCVTTGLGHRHCNLCSKDEAGTTAYPLDPNNHKNLGAVFQTTIQPTCTAVGDSYLFCSACNKHDTNDPDSYMEVPARGHDMINNWVTIKLATCTANGDRERQCNRSGCTHKETDLDTNSVPSYNGHQYPATTPPTCTITSIPHACSRLIGTEVCDHANPEQIAAALGHTMPAWIAPTCTEAGHSSRTCTLSCGETGDIEYRAAPPALGHNYTWTLNNAEITALTGIQINGNCSHQTEASCVTIANVTLAEYIADYAPQAGTAAAPVPLKVSISLGTMGFDANGWTQLLTALDTGKKLVSLDLSGSTRSSNGSFFTGSSRDFPAAPGLIGLRQIVSLVVPSTTITLIDNSSFRNCTNLTSVTIPNSVTRFGDSVFYGCTGLTSITIPNGVTSIDFSTFYGCTSLTSVTIPAGVTSIGNSVFENCTNLTSVTIPNSVTSIGNSVFQNCTGLTSITIPNGVTSIGNRTFYGCTGLTSVTIPAGVTSIGDSAFNGCTGLTSVTIPNSVTSIGMSAFNNCTNLTLLTIERWMPSLSGDARITTAGYRPFPYGNLRIVVPVGSVAVYKAASGWNDSYYVDRIHAVGCSNTSVTANCTQCN